MRRTSLDGTDVNFVQVGWSGGNICEDWTKLTSTVSEIVDVIGRFGQTTGNICVSWTSLTSVSNRRFVQLCLSLSKISSERTPHQPHSNAKQAIERLLSRFAVAVVVLLLLLCWYVSSSRRHTDVSRLSYSPTDVGLTSTRPRRFVQ